MLLEHAALRVPPEARAEFLRQAELVLTRARARAASRAELELALGVLSVLWGASGAGVAAGGAADGRAPVVGA